LRDSDGVPVRLSWSLMGLNHYVARVVRRQDAVRHMARYCQVPGNFTRTSAGPRHVHFVMVMAVTRVQQPHYYSAADHPGEECIVIYQRKWAARDSNHARWREDSLCSSWSDKAIGPVDYPASSGDNSAGGTSDGPARGTGSTSTATNALLAFQSFVSQHA
jgi:hypothetical protein